MVFESILSLLLLLVIPLLFYFRLKINKLPGLQFSSVKRLKKTGRTWKEKLFHLPFYLRIVTLILLIVVLARPQQGKEEIRDISKGIAVYAAIDRSSSMKAEMSYGDKELTRLQTVKKVFQEFVNGNNDDLKGRPNDVIGMISFAKYADTICPLTLSHGAISQFLKTIKLVKGGGPEDGTAIGDALALAAARLKTAEEYLKNKNTNKKKYEIKSKIIILLTDGQHNSGKRNPTQAAKLAKEWGIKIYPIGIGGNESFVTINTIFGPQKMHVNSNIDESTLKYLAKTTGGIYRMAKDAKSLKDIYKEIDKLERTEIQSVRYLDLKEVFPIFALIALGLLVLEVILTCTVFRRIP